jgi:O-acetyl-ADP-ribose deacetylase (regulator of RNase III)
MAFQIVRNDITKIKADAIVNTANPEPTYMAGTDAAVYEAAGAEDLLKERRKAGIIKPGGVAVTPAFNLDAKYIFHTVGPVWEGGNYGEKEVVKNCYENCLKKAVELDIGSIAFPLISTGIYGFPKTDALLIATGVFSEFLTDHELDITLVVFDNESFELSGRIFAGVDEYIDGHYVEEKLDEEYGFAGAAVFGTANYSMPPEEVLEEVTDEEPQERRHSRRSRLFGLHQEARSAMPCADVAAPAPKPAAKEAKKRSLDDVVKNISDTWSESLLRMIDEKGYTDVEVYKRANADRKLFSKIRSNKDYQPKKATALAFALALRLNIDETKDFLGRAGYALSNSSVTDLIVEYFIENEVYDIMTINVALFDHDQPLLG